jgi:guanine nucleotide-binding protein subunit beta-2-like 1 protein
MSNNGPVTFDGQLKGHRGWVTAVACPSQNDASAKLVSASRDNTVVVWKECSRSSTEESLAVPIRRLEGHSDFVQDVSLSNNAEFALSASWDKSLRLWNLKTGDCITKFHGHTKDALSAAFSPDNRQIVSGGRDNRLRLWNVKGDCIFTTQDRDSHTDWVSCVRFSPTQNQASIVVSGGWDNLVKVWSLSGFRCQSTLRGHTGFVSSVTVSPDGSLCASAGKDGKAKLWDLNRGEHLYELDAAEPINQIAFSPNRYWLCAATQSTIRIWDLESKEVVAELVPETQNKKFKPECTSIAWSADGSTLYSGYTDNIVRVWGIRDS